MSFLLCCIFQTRTNQKPPQPTCANNVLPIMFITSGNLSAAVSRIVSSYLTPDTSHMLAYEKTIALLHRDFTVVPMRYGCVLEEESRIVRLLESRREAYTSLLSELEGCVEMGIRALKKCEDDPLYDGEASSPLLMGQERHCAGPGLDYLAARKLHHARKERLAGQGLEVIEKIRGPFAGLYIRCKVENRGPRIGNLTLPAHLFSLHFLVPRESLEAFRKRFYSISMRGSSKLLLSGPWPPFNFVVSDHAQARSKPDPFL